MSQDQAVKSNGLLSKEEISRELKPLSNNAFLAFFQKLWRSWLAVWYNYADKHPKASGWIYKLALFFIFSNGVTILQLLIMLFLPYAFKGIWDVSFVWPAIALPWKDAAGVALNYAIFNEPVQFLIDGSIVMASNAKEVAAYIAQGLSPEVGGLGNFLSFEIAVFCAQCINLPLQRNITFKSKGNIYMQAAWYFIGWVGISVGVNALWGIMNPLMLSWSWNKVAIDLIKTVVTGGVSMAIFFPIFLIIFPDSAKVAKSAAAKAEKAKASGADSAKVADLEAKAAKAAKTAELDRLEKEAAKTATQANARAIAYVAAVNAGSVNAEQYQQVATEAIAVKHAAAEAYQAAKA